ncbi:hypothetical protein MCOR14_012039 [Pyricularia oryzae]|nr:hypothetical protein MCOR34_011523 [Pyricularia oryzae]KAI6443458.1 hypothetical protein MCOR17_011403 [Pyricularia oryzae]KAI6476520.1 hypothetical protein MCOR13_011824 [Pyricularia oryzae]KAI6609479.1 hypothetical protein MCOR14_012039 [Pyricularia oryzae]
METGRSRHMVPTQQTQEDAAEHLPNAREIEAFSDAELTKHLWDNSRCVTVRDPENISESFLERLREMVRSHNVPHSAVVDLNGVNAKLLATEPKGREVSPASSDRVTEILDDTEDGEVSSHRDLVGAGGRPAYPIQLLDQVWENPRAYRDILSLFCFSEYEWENPTIFAWQKSRWDLFRAWQKDGRTGRICTGGTSQAAVKLIQSTRAGDRGLASYVESVRTNALVPLRLQTDLIAEFDPTQDPIIQNALTTWLEYVAYRYIQTKCESNSAAHHKKHLQKTWEELVSMELLTPSELEKGIVRLNSSSWDAASETPERVKLRLGGIRRYTCSSMSLRWAENALERDAAELSWALRQLPLVQAEAEEHQRRKELDTKHATKYCPIQKDTRIMAEAQKTSDSLRRSPRIAAKQAQKAATVNLPTVPERQQTVSIPRKRVRQTNAPCTVFQEEARDNISSRRRNQARPADSVRGPEQDVAPRKRRKV